MTYWELNIPLNPPRFNPEKSFRVLRRLGYGGWAVNYQVDAKDIKEGLPDLPKAKGGKTESYMSIEETKRRPLSLPVPGQGYPSEFEIKNRLTVNVHTVKDISVLLSHIKRKRYPYHLIAARPFTEQSFQRCCDSEMLDIISIDISQRLEYRPKLSFLQKAQKKGISFEICYAPAIRDPTLRRNTIGNAAELIRLLRGRNIILTSGAGHSFELRGPHDVINLGIIFGLKEKNAHQSITSIPKSIMDRASTNSPDEFKME
ncbi:hypothetical protein AAMO2058_001321400 [Amorphochlora amoebiformis]